VTLTGNFLLKWFFYFTDYFFDFISCAQRPATTTAKRLAKLDDVAFVGGCLIFIHLYCSLQEMIFSYY
jgi:hypothetical protein